MMSDAEGYVIRYRFDGRTLLLLGACVVAVIVLLQWRGATSSVRARSLKPTLIVAASVVGVRLTYLAARRTVVARVERDGITLEARRFERLVPARYRWDEIVEVVVFEFLLPGRRTARRTSIGVRPRPDARGTDTTMDLDQLGNAAVQQRVPEEVAARSRPLGAASLDARQLCDAVARFAPDVRVVRVDYSGRRRTLCPAQ